jgi:hypothetical protein
LPVRGRDIQILSFEFECFNLSGNENEQPHFGRTRLCINVFSLRHRNYTDAMFEILMNSAVDSTRPNLVAIHRRRFLFYLLSIPPSFTSCHVCFCGNVVRSSHSSRWARRSSAVIHPPMPRCPGMGQLPDSFMCGDYGAPRLRVN